MMFFCNGIMNDAETAKKSARKISDIFEGREVGIFDNPTGTLGAVKSRRSAKREQRKNVRLFADQIHNFILAQQTAGIKEDEIHVLLFAHSHGTVVTKAALNKLDKTDREKIDVYAFGGPKIIPRRLANVVQNYAFHEDKVADFGNYFTPSTLSLKKIKGIFEDAIENGETTIGDAVYRRAKHDTQCELISKCFEAATIERHKRILIEKDEQALLEDPFFIKRLQAYHSYFLRNPVEILYPPEEESSAASFSFVAAFQETHPFSSYAANKLEAIAKRYLD